MINTILLHAMTFRPATPPSSEPASALPISEALARSAPLARLCELIKDSRARFAVIAPLMPPSLAAHVLPGPVSEEGWALLAANTAVAAKLRQLTPRFEAALKAQGWREEAIRIRIQQN